MIEIPLWRGGRWHGQVVAFAFVSDEDWELGQLRWTLSQEGYAERTTPRPEHRMVSMARSILGLAPGDRATADHIDRNKLNNARDNLRVIPWTAQAQNRIHSVHSTGAAPTSIYRGVSRAKSGRWRAHCKGVHLGTFDTEDDAARAAIAAREALMPYATG